MIESKNSFYVYSRIFVFAVVSSFITPAYQDTVRDRKMCFFVEFSAEEKYFVDLFGVFIFVFNASLRS